MRRLKVMRNCSIEGMGLQVMAGCRVDSGLAAAYSSLQASRFGVPPTEVVLANRSEELLSQFPTGLLADLRVLAFHAGLPAETRHYKELLQYYTNVRSGFCALPD